MGRAEGAAEIFFTVHRTVSYTQESFGPNVTSAKVEKSCCKL